MREVSADWRALDGILADLGGKDAFSTLLKRHSVAEEFLSEVVKKGGRSKIAEMAKNKLELES